MSGVSLLTKRCELAFGSFSTVRSLALAGLARDFKRYRGRSLRTAERAHVSMLMKCWSAERGSSLKPRRQALSSPLHQPNDTVQMEAPFSLAGRTLFVPDTCFLPLTPPLLPVRVETWFLLPLTYLISPQISWFGNRNEHSSLF